MGGATMGGATMGGATMGGATRRRARARRRARCGRPGGGRTPAVDGTSWSTPQTRRLHSAVQWATISAGRCALSVEGRSASDSWSLYNPYGLIVVHVRVCAPRADGQCFLFGRNAIFALPAREAV
eukprot:193306-Prymnesium_polylepis.1